AEETNECWQFCSERKQRKKNGWPKWLPSNKNEKQKKQSCELSGLPTTRLTGNSSSGLPQRKNLWNLNSNCFVPFVANLSSRSVSGSITNVLKVIAIVWPNWKPLSLWILNSPRLLNW